MAAERLRGGICTGINCDAGSSPPALTRLCAVVPPPLRPDHCHLKQVYALEKAGGSIIGGVIKQIQAKRANPPPPRDARLPPKPAGQTVGSFKRGLQSLPRAIAAKHADRCR